MQRIRSGGLAGSSGTYAPPALRMPRTLTTRSTDRSRQTATRTSDETPYACRQWASWLALASSSPYVRRRSPSTIAVRYAVAAACDVTLSCSVRGVASPCLLDLGIDPQLFDPAYRDPVCPARLGRDRPCDVVLG